ncbi:MAG TPA: hypothetical protein VHL58_01585 [Thermoanaerobaculia bacterium]|nr:hypothetical protein [Thermoanaerobaculia bacterium]
MKLINTVLSVLTITYSGMLFAQEHPTATKSEHPKAPAPTTTVAKEHPEHPKGDKAKAETAKKFSMDELENAIKRDVATKEKAGGGYLKLNDKATKKTWLLKLDHVHRERLSQLDSHTYFACSDFKSKDGHLVDVDFFEKEKDGKLEMSDMTIHKVDGKARYGWEEKDGFWKRVPVAK